MTLYDILGVDKGADASAIKKAYRLLAQQLHPDRDTGDADRFRQVQQAYEVLSDPDRRAQYDATGTVTSALERRHAAEQLAAALVQVALMADAPSWLQLDPIEQARKEVASGLAGDRIGLADNERRLVKIRRGLTRIKRKQGQNLVVLALQQEQAKLEAYAVGNREHQAMLAEVLVVLGEYSYEDSSAFFSEPLGEPLKLG